MSPAGPALEAVRSLRAAAGDAEAWPSYFERHQLHELLPDARWAVGVALVACEDLVRGLAAHEPEDPVRWIIRELVARSAAPPEVPEQKAKKKGVGVNISACLRRGCRALLDLVCDENSGWQELEDASDTSVAWAQQLAPPTEAKIFFVWSGQGLLQRLGHPAATEKVPRLPRHATVNRWPGIGYICAPGTYIACRDEKGPGMDFRAQNEQKTHQKPSKTIERPHVSHGFPPVTHRGQGEYGPGHSALAADVAREVQLLAPQLAPPQRDRAAERLAPEAQGPETQRWRHGGLGRPRCGKEPIKRSIKKPSVGLEWPPISP